MLQGGVAIAYPHYHLEVAAMVENDGIDYMDWCVTEQTGTGVQRPCLRDCGFVFWLSAEEAKLAVGTRLGTDGWLLSQFRPEGAVD